MDKKIESITIQGNILLFGGVYSNLQALEKLKRIAEQNNIPAENCICTGDIVGYCAQPEETVQLFKLWGARSIAGNVEIQLKNGAEDCGCDFKKGSRCDSFSQLWYPFAQSKLSKSSLKFISNLPDHIQFQYANKSVTVVHGDWFNVSEFIFKSTPWHRKQATFDASKSDIIIAGHCGLPFKQHHAETKNLWINPGVIGMPANDGTPDVWYAILSQKNDAIVVNHFSMSYNHKLTSSLMQNSLLPQEYARTIITGIWDNTEILPPVESGLQGFGIEP